MIDYTNLSSDDSYRLFLARALRLQALMTHNLSWTSNKPSDIKEFSTIANWLPPAIRPNGDDFYLKYQDWD